MQTYNRVLRIFLVSIFLAAGFFLPALEKVAAQTTENPPQTIPLPQNISSIAGPFDYSPERGIRYFRGPELETSEKTVSLRIPSFCNDGKIINLPSSLRSFVWDTLIPQESTYFQPGIGVDPKTGMPFDHIRIRLKENMLGEVGHYTAASKLSLSIPFFLKIIQRAPALRKVPVSPSEAKKILLANLNTLLTYYRKYPETGGFLSWVDIRPNGSIAPSNEKIPSLDNGQLTWSLVAVVAGLENSKDPQELVIASKAVELLNLQDYRKFYDPDKGLLHGTIQWNPSTQTWKGDSSYYLNDMCEGTLAVLWAVLNRQLPEEVWYRLQIPTVEYLTEGNESITTLKGFRASFHENWALAFIPLMDSALAPLYSNYLYAQADHARQNGLTGFVSTAYDPQGVYRQMGIPAIAAEKVDRQDVSVFFATVMGMMISPIDTLPWLSKISGMTGFISSYGALESAGKDGYADIFTADGKGMSLLALTGGVTDEVRTYLQTRRVPGSKVTLYEKLIELLHAKYKQMLHERHGKPLLFPTLPFPLPAPGYRAISSQKPVDAGDFFSITNHLQSGHLHGKNVRSVGCETLEQDICPGKPLAFEYDIPAYASYFDQWAFRGTYLDKAVRIAGMRYITIAVPAGSRANAFELELKSDDITLATIPVDTRHPGVLSQDGTMKIFVEQIDPIPEADYKALNYIAAVIHDPRYLLNSTSNGGRSGTLHIEKIALSKNYPLKGHNPGAEPPESGAVEEFEAIRYWRLSHGSIPFYKNPITNSYHLSGGSGWRGGYMPYTNLNKFNYLYIKARNTGSERNHFHVELKHEDNQLLGDKILIDFPLDSDWHIFQIPIPKNVTRAFNYLAISDPDKDFELAALLLTQLPLDSASLKILPPRKKASLRSRSIRKGPPEGSLTSTLFVSTNA